MLGPKPPLVKGKPDVTLYSTLTFDIETIDRALPSVLLGIATRAVIVSEYWLTVDADDGSLGDAMSLTDCGLSKFCGVNWRVQTGKSSVGARRYTDTLVVGWLFNRTCTPPDMPLSAHRVIFWGERTTSTEGAGAHSLATPTVCVTYVITKEMATINSFILYDAFVNAKCWMSFVASKSKNEHFLAWQDVARMR
jgi:hypothetical protein